MGTDGTVEVVVEVVCRTVVVVVVAMVWPVPSVVPSCVPDEEDTEVEEAEVPPSDHPGIDGEEESDSASPAVRLPHQNRNARTKSSTAATAATVRINQGRR